YSGCAVPAPATREEPEAPLLRAPRRPRAARRLRGRVRAREREEGARQLRLRPRVRLAHLADPARAGRRARRRDADPAARAPLEPPLARGPPAGRPRLRSRPARRS